MNVTTYLLTSSTTVNLMVTNISDYNTHSTLGIILICTGMTIFFIIMFCLMCFKTRSESSSCQEYII
ncbi:hypothetical protein [Carp edema virus]|nr:hypothetical protein [Carp edema virus]